MPAGVAAMWGFAPAGVATAIAARIPVVFQDDDYDDVPGVDVIRV
jgi:hypothetical protein